jgi:2-polyprenyl-3-methyl-5-hydroxy-6-metoxy-1,4-benzoquinol methylase
MPEDQTQPQLIISLLDAVYPAFALLAGMELDLFTVLDDKPRSLGEIAETLRVQASKLRPLMYVLVVSGLISEENGFFRNTPEAQQFLVRGKPAFLGETHKLTSNNWKRILETAATIRNGGPLAEYDYHSGQEELVSILRGLYPGTVKDAHTLLNLFDFSDKKSLLDIGGGSGGLAITLVKAIPNLQATILDLPAVTPITMQFIQEAGLEGRIVVESVDAVREQISGTYDVVLARHLFQVLSEDNNRALLRNIAGAVQPGGLLFIIGWVLNDSRKSPKKTVEYNLILLNGYEDGQAYIESEYKGWLSEAGFESFQRVVLPNGDSIICVRKSAQK